MPGGSDLASCFSAAHSTQSQIQFFNPALMESSGAPSMLWDNWLRLYKFFVTASGLDTATEKLKLVVLYGSIGVNAASIASDITDAHTTYDDSITRLSERFGERQ